MSIHVLELANWQRGGGRKGGGTKPKPLKLPEERRVSVKTADELREKRHRQAEHLRQRRQQKHEGR